jgi:hypothetical protein
VTEHDVLVGHRLRLFTLADELQNVSKACRLVGVHGSTYYRWDPATRRRIDCRLAVVVQGVVTRLPSLGQLR